MPQTDASSLSWQNVHLYQFLSFVGMALLVFFFCLKGERWFPILDSANLMFHEAGHPLVAIFSSHLSVYGGTLAQLTFPILFSFYFFKKRAPTSMAFTLLWFFENIFNISRYLSDARAQELPLVGGEHDWTEILGRFHLLEQDKTIGLYLNEFAITGIVLTGYWLFTRWRKSRNS